MKSPAAWFRDFSGSLTYGVISAWMLAAMMLAWTVQSVFHDLPAARLLLLIGIAVGSAPLLIDLVRELWKRNFSVDALAGLAVLSALALREYWVTAIILLMLSGGKSLEAYATRRASSILAALARRMPRTAHRVSPDGSFTDVQTEAVAVGDTLAIFPHELCPVDGVVIEGNGAMDESYLTGEPFLIGKAPGASVLSGSINGNSSLTVRATRLVADSRYASIVEVLHASEKHRPRIRRIGDRIGVWFTPAAIAIALVSWAASGDPDRFLAVLVIATPCPLLLAIPIAVLGAVSIAARRGIVIKDPSILETIDSTKTLIVDKTGTLTRGVPSLTEVISTGRWPTRAILAFAASVEQYSKHPLGPAVVAAAKAEGIVLIPAQDVFELPGHGLRGHVDGHLVMLTSREKLTEHTSGSLPSVGPGLECVVLIDGEVAAIFRFQDEPRKESAPFLRHLRSHHEMDRVILLSGDRQSEVAAVAAHLGIVDLHGGKSPEEKVAIVQETTAQGPTLYIGDGINDAPAMLNATVGIALGVNSEITSEAAGAVVLQSSLASVDELMHIGRRMKRIALLSAVGGMGLSALGMAAGALGYMSAIQGAILQEGIDLLAILNSLRILLMRDPVGDFEVPAVPAEPVKTSGPPLAPTAWSKASRM